MSKIARYLVISFIIVVLLTTTLACVAPDTQYGKPRYESPERRYDGMNDPANPFSPLSPNWLCNP